MKKLCEEIEKIAGVTSTPKSYSNDDRLNVLCIKYDVSEIKKLSFRHVNFDQNDYAETTRKIIDLRNLVGINREYNVTNWLELLFKLNKKHNFDKFTTKNNFEKYVDSLSVDSYDLPEVLEINEEYFIDTNGKHRLTIAKCLSLQYFPVISRKCK